MQQWPRLSGLSSGMPQLGSDDFVHSTLQAFTAAPAGLMPLSKAFSMHQRADSGQITST